jgi:NAD(P)-dependent dehydrogenase (short-subunit alcohol dehydrogenase family)
VHLGAAPAGTSTPVFALGAVQLDAGTYAAAMPSGLRVMVTAGGAGIGATIARSFAAGGALVSVADIDPAALERTLAEDRQLTGVAIDVSSPADVDGWFDDVERSWGGVDVLVNNAGMAGPTAFVEDISLQDWRSCLAVGLDSHFLASRRAATAMKAQRAGSIIAISSTAGLFGMGLRTPYAAAKWAVIGLVKSLAIELGPFGVRANAICPGSVDGPRMRRVIDAEAATRGVSPEQVQRGYLDGQSISRFVRPGEVADLCRFLASPDAAMISGQAIAVDGHTETFRIAGD